MKKSTELGLAFFGLPFVVSAAVEFLPQWAAWPIAVTLGMVWFGVIVQTGNYDFEKEKENK